MHQVQELVLSWLRAFTIFSVRTFSLLGEKGALSLSVYVALTYIPGGGLLTGFAMRSEPKGFSGLVHH